MCNECLDNDHDHCTPQGLNKENLCCCICNERK